MEICTYLIKSSVHGSVALFLFLAAGFRFPSVLAATNFVRRSPCGQHLVSEKLARVGLGKGLETMAPVALEGGSVSELNTGSKLGFDSQSHLSSVLELKEWLVGRVGDDNDIVVDDLQVFPTQGGEIETFSGRPQRKAGAGGREGWDQGNQRMVQQRGSNCSLQGESPGSSWRGDKWLALGRVQKVFFMQSMRCSY